MTSPDAADPTEEPVTVTDSARRAALAALPDAERTYLGEITAAVTAAVGDDVRGLWLIGGGAQAAYDPGVSDLDVLLVTGRRWPAPARTALGERIVHPALPCPAVGLEFVWYADPDLHPLGDPVVFALNVNGGPGRGRLIGLGPEPGDDQWWAVLDLAAARRVGVALLGPAPNEVLPEIPRDRLVAAIRDSQAFHDGPDAGSPNRVLNLARMVALLEDGRWLSKAAGAKALRERAPQFAPVLDAALTARADGSWIDTALASALSDRVRDLAR